MKLYIFAFSIFALIVDSYSSDISLFEDCIREIAIPKGAPTVLNAADAQMKCYEACVMRKLEIMVDGKIDIDASYDYTKNNLRKVQRDLREIVKSCAGKANVQNNECEVASIMKNCMANELQKGK